MEIILTIALAMLATITMLLLAFGVFGSEPKTKASKSAEPTGESGVSLGKRFGIPALVAIVSFGVFQWVALSFVLAFAATVLPPRWERNKTEAAYSERTEALASWIEQLRDAVTSAGGLEQPLMRTAETGPESLKGPLGRVLTDMRVYDTETALINFSRNVDHHIADMFVAAYIAASRDSTEGIESLLDDIATTAQAEVRTYRRVNVSRKQTKMSLRMMVFLIVGSLIGSQTVFTNFSDAYSSLAGQIVLAVIAGISLSAYLWASKLQEIRRPPRFFSGAAEKEEL